MGLVVIAAAIGTLNAVIAGVPRILYGMALTRQLPSPFGWLLPRTRAPWVGIIVLAAIPILMNAFGAAEGAKFLQLILAGVLGWVTAYFLIHVCVVVLRRREPDAGRPYRSPLMPLPQILGAGLLALGAYKIAPPGIDADSIYYRWLIFLAISAAFSLVYNLYAFKSLGAIFKPVPLAEVYRETELIEEELPLPVDPGLPTHPLDPDLPVRARRGEGARWALTSPTSWRRASRESGSITRTCSARRGRRSSRWSYSSSSRRTASTSACRSSPSTTSESCRMGRACGTR